MGGPALIVLYHALNIDKSAVRAANAWQGLVQVSRQPGCAIWQGPVPCMAGTCVGEQAYKAA